MSPFCLKASVAPHGPQNTAQSFQVAMRPFMVWQPLCLCSLSILHLEKRAITLPTSPVLPVPGALSPLGLCTTTGPLNSLPFPPGVFLILTTTPGGGNLYPSFREDTESRSTEVLYQGDTEVLYQGDMVLKATEPGFETRPICCLCSVQHIAVPRAGILSLHDVNR